LVEQSANGRRAAPTGRPFSFNSDSFSARAEAANPAPNTRLLRGIVRTYARWNDGWDIEKVKVELQSWQTAKNEVRLANILGKEQKAKSLF